MVVQFGMMGRNRKRRSAGQDGRPPLDRQQTLGFFGEEDLSDAQHGLGPLPVLGAGGPAQPPSRAKYPITRAPPAGRFRPARDNRQPSSNAPAGVSYQRDDVT